MAASLRVIGSAFRLEQEHAAARIVAPPANCRGRSAGQVVLAPADAREWATDSVVDTANHTSRAFMAGFRAIARCAPVRGVTTRQSAASRAVPFPGKWEAGYEGGW